MPENQNAAGEVTPEQYDSFTHSVRALADATLRTQVGADEIARAEAEIRAITERLAADQIPGTYGEHQLNGGVISDWGNTAVGLRNAMAIPVKFTFEPERVWAELTPGALYEGPPGHMHGGMIALLLDQVLGELAAHLGKPGLTASLSVDYKRPTKLNQSLRLEAWLDRSEGYKTWTKGTLSDANGVCAEGTGVFILPRFLREMPPEQRAAFRERD